MTESQAAQIIASQQRIEAKLDALLLALAEDGEEEAEPMRTLDGDAIPGERDQCQSLG